MIRTDQSSNSTYGLQIQNYWYQWTK